MNFDFAALHCTTKRIHFNRRWTVRLCCEQIETNVRLIATTEMQEFM